MTELGGTPPRRITPLSGMPAHEPPRSFPLSKIEIDRLVQHALNEDRAFEDITTASMVVSDRRARARLVARCDGVIAGVPLATAAFCLVDPKFSIRVDHEDSARVRGGDIVLYLTGHARSMLSAERVALNYLQRLSGIATLTRRFVEAVAGTSAQILDTRKTTPGWRALEKYAVKCGGGVNHRMDLASAILIKDNHLTSVEGDIALAVRRCREHAPQGMFVQVECETPAQVEAGVGAGADSVLLDNMVIDDIVDSVRIAKGKSITEVSGGVSLTNVRTIAETGVDRISIGALTHSAPALDLALDFE